LFNLIIKRSWLFLILLYIQGVFIVLISDKIFPEKYFNDSKMIKDFYPLVTNLHFNFFDSYTNTARFYLIFGFGNFDSRIIEGLFTYTVFFICMFLVYRISGIPLTNRVFLFLCVWNAPTAVFLGQITKEVIALLVITFQLYALYKNTIKIKIIGAAIILFYALFFRSYWVIIIYFAVLIAVLVIGHFKVKGYKIIIDTIWKPLFFIVGVLFLFFAAGLMGQYLTDFRTDVNIYRQNDPDAVTLINNAYINTSVGTDLLNWVLAWLTLIVPVKLLLLAEIQHIFFAVWNLFSVCLFIYIAKYLINHKIKDIPVIWSIAWIVSFSLVQGLFEPDFGSFVRHESVLLPMFFYIFLRYEKFRFEKKNKELSVSLEDHCEKDTSYR
jgi:hypothetical protein